MTKKRADSGRQREIEQALSFSGAVFAETIDMPGRNVPARGGKGRRVSNAAAPIESRMKPRRFGGNPYRLARHPGLPYFVIQGGRLYIGPFHTMSIAQRAAEKAFPHASDLLIWGGSAAR